MSKHLLWVTDSWALFIWWITRAVSATNQNEGVETTSSTEIMITKWQVANVINVQVSLSLSVSHKNRPCNVALVTHTVSTSYQNEGVETTSSTEIMITKWQVANVINVQVSLSLSANHKNRPCYVAFIAKNTDQRTGLLPSQGIFVRTWGSCSESRLSQFCQTASLKGHSVILASSFYDIYTGVYIGKASKYQLRCTESCLFQFCQAASLKGHLVIVASSFYNYNMKAVTKYQLTLILCVQVKGGNTQFQPDIEIRE